MILFTLEYYSLIAVVGIEDDGNNLWTEQDVSNKRTSLLALQLADSMYVVHSTRQTTRKFDRMKNHRSKHVPL